jgi:hypothetical protein
MERQPQQPAFALGSDRVLQVEEQRLGRGGVIRFEHVDAAALLHHEHAVGSVGGRLDVERGDEAQARVGLLELVLRACCAERGGEQGGGQGQGVCTAYGYHAADNGEPRHGGYVSHQL